MTQVIDAFMSGLEAAGEDVDLSTLASVASFFVSRVDTEVDRRLDALGTPEAKGLRGKAAIANARLAYELFEQRFDSAALAGAGRSRGAGCSARCGRRPAPRTRPTGTRCTSRTWSRRTP